MLAPLTSTFSISGESRVIQQRDSEELLMARERNSIATSFLGLSLPPRIALRGRAA